MKLLWLSQWGKCAISLCYLTIPHSPYHLAANTSFIPPHSPFDPTDYVGLASNTVGLHSWGNKFRSWQGYCLSWLRILLVLLILFLNEYNIALSNNGAPSQLPSCPAIAIETASLYNHLNSPPFLHLCLSFLHCSIV